jgi:cytidylate kinase
MNRFNIAIDGPASSGKGTIARRVAASLGYVYIDTGAMYRAVALAASTRGISLSEEDLVVACAQALTIRVSSNADGQQLHLDGVDATDALRLPEHGRGASIVSTYAGVRAALTQQQRALGNDGGVVMDGRDIGSVVLPDARLKVYLDASIKARAKRRFIDLKTKDPELKLSVVEEALAARDARDMNRAHAPLQRTKDALYIDSTELTIDDVVNRILAAAAQEGRNDATADD